MVRTSDRAEGTGAAEAMAREGRVEAMLAEGVEGPAARRVEVAAAALAVEAAPAEEAAARRVEVAAAEEPAAQAAAREGRAEEAEVRRVEVAAAAAAEERAPPTHRWIVEQAAVARSSMLRLTAVRPAEAIRNCAAAPASARPIPGTAAPGRAVRHVHFPMRRPRALALVNARWGPAPRVSPIATRLRRTAAKRICPNPRRAVLARRCATPPRRFARARTERSNA